MLEVLPQIDLQNYNTLAVPAVADYFAEITHCRDLTKALDWNKRRGLPLLVLGEGSNIVLKGNFPGLVLHIAIPGIDVVAENKSHVWIKAGAGENWHQLIEHCLQRCYWGLENLSLIPGSVGAAPIQNIGAYGVELQDVFYELQALEVSSGASVTFNNNDCHFGYRDSIFKSRLRDRYIITSVTLKLHRSASTVNLSYPGLREAAERSGATLSPKLVSDLVCDIRRAKLPAPYDIPNVGSFFKNPVVDKDIYISLQQQYPELVAYPLDGGEFKLAAAWLVEQAGWKGQGADGVAVHDRQALVLVNPGRRWGRDVLALAERIQISVAKKFAVQLELEPRVYPHI